MAQPLSEDKAKDARAEASLARSAPAKVEPAKAAPVKVAKAEAPKPAKAPEKAVVAEAPKPVKAAAPKVVEPEVVAPAEAVEPAPVAPREESPVLDALEAAKPVEAAEIPAPVPAPAVVEVEPKVAAPVEAIAPKPAAPKKAAPARKAVKAVKQARPAKASAPAAKAKPKAKAKAVKTRRAAPVAKTTARPAVPVAKAVKTGVSIMTIDTNKAAVAAAEQIKTVVAEANGRARAAMEKSTKIIEELAELGRGNIEALIASSKLAAKGVETFSEDAATYSRKSLETATAAFKSFADVKSPTDFFKLQGDYTRSAFDAAVAESARVSEAALKLANDVAEPLTSRYAVAAERVKTLAA